MCRRSNSEEVSFPSLFVQVIDASVHVAERWRPLQDTGLHYSLTSDHMNIRNKAGLMSKMTQQQRRVSFWIIVN